MLEPSKTKIIFLAIIFFGLFGWAGSSFAATYYVRTDGNNNCTGLVDAAGSSGSCAWRTLQKAADTMVSGDTVNVADGTYAGFMMQTTGTSGSPIIFHASGTGANITSRNPTTQDGINIESWGADPADYITVDGFNVYNQPRMGIRAIGGIGIIIQNCTSHNNSSNGIFSSDTPNIQVLNNTVYANGGNSYEHNIYISNALSDGAIVRGNVVYDSNYGNGIQLNGDWEMGGDGYIDNAVIENNIVSGSAAKGFSLISIRNGLIQNNITYDNNGAGGIHIVEQLDQNYSSGNTVVNNTLHELNTACVRINSGNTNNVVFNNICIGSTGIIFEGTGNYQSNNYSAATAGSSIFVNATTRNYHLLVNSPAKDYGVASYRSKPAAVVDLESSGRPQGAGYDAGAYEYVEGGSPDTTPPAAPTGLSVS